MHGAALSAAFATALSPGRGQRVGEDDLGDAKAVEMCGADAVGYAGGEQGPANG
ncbi:hypothetical protein ACFU8W_44260 [Streptomyces sp. NPDC057565]|uniref:hypothetical protein n=1 Tax=Streptomyces sp. NPDC057565 TaxID=3346169 RepID=UPI00367D9743